ncbi:hypothetical protein CEXT_128251 [Caerostris extrusa]|uniref:Uncharacterized protein n=1 Tax=Caerostris extrusa TaxID=172846 RepID=A0AAV4P8X3_CAEEX|nr:hypothetical protein CEXT_128251 [Caerostris extrusa]
MLCYFNPYEHGIDLIRNLFPRVSDLVNNCVPFASKLKGNSSNIDWDRVPLIGFCVDSRSKGFPSTLAHVLCLFQLNVEDNHCFLGLEL